MKSKVLSDDVSALLRARNPLIWVVTNEEARVERHLFAAAGAAGYVPRTWDVADGVTDLSGKPLVGVGGPDPLQTLDTIRDRVANPSSPERGLWIMRDLSAWLEGLPGAQIRRKLRNLARVLPSAPRDCAQAIIILTTSGDVPPDLAAHATVINWALPDREEIEDILESVLESLPDDLKGKAVENGGRAAAIDAAVGLSGEEAASCYARSLVQSRKVDAALVAAEKKRVIARERVLEWFDPLPGGLEAVGGLDMLKAWLAARSSAYSPEAREYGLPAPKGVLLGGIPGCGKSLTAKAVATAWGVPLLRVDLGALKSKFVGESEANLRKAFEVIGAIGRCVVWFDEIEKSLAGATQGAADGGVSSDALGAILGWMQDRQGEAFVVATANDVESLPAELLRKGRFDEIFWVDLPTQEERAAIVAASLKSHNRKADGIDLSAVARTTSGFSGAEIAALVPEALFAAFGDGARPISTEDLINAAKTVVPLSTSAATKIDRLRKWADGKARLASKPEAEGDARGTGRNIDL